MSSNSQNVGRLQGTSASGGQDGGTSRKGSVRAARQRLDAMQKNQEQGYLPTARPRVGLPSRPNELVSQFAMKEPKTHQAPVEIDRSTPYAVDEQEEDEYNSFNNPRQAPYPGRGPPPARPPRPDDVSASVDPTLNFSQEEQQYATQRPGNLGHPSYPEQDQEFLSPIPSSGWASRPLTTSSQDTNSTLGDIPDFPQPEYAQQGYPHPDYAQGAPRSRPMLGPPPSARRGPSSYWSQQSFVSPIVEESEGTRSRNSMASSNVMPDFYLDEGERSPSDYLDDSSRSSRTVVYEDRSGLVRQASLGRRTKPSLTTIKSADTLREESTSRGASKKSSKNSLVGQGAVAAGAMGAAYAAGSSSRSGFHSPKSNLSGGTGLLDASSDSEGGDSPATGGASSTLGKSPSAPALSRASPGPSDPFNDTSPNLKFPERANVRRAPPAPLNIGAVREAETRGSMTSLPDLIRRATRVAANLDRGKTASKLINLNDFTGADPYAQEKKNHHQRKGSLSDMLASFPPPGLATPDQASFNTKRMSKWPTGHPYATSGSRIESRNEKQSQRRGRRCCGMPLWAFVVSMVILFLLVAAAVVVPVVLIVLPRQRDAAQSDESASRCSTQQVCQNGGVPYPTAGGGCGCLCQNGFIGNSCETASGQGCTTIDIPGADAATIGTALPRLLENAQSNFSIPLDASTIVTLFSEAGITCNTQNSLVLFNGVSQRDLEAADALLSRRSLTPSPVVVPRQDNSALPTSLLVDQSPEPTAAPAQPAATNSISPQDAASNANIVDFARVAVLFIFQDARSLDFAASAQESLGDFLDGTANRAVDSRNITLQNGFFINLNERTLELLNGTTIP